MIEGVWLPLLDSRRLLLRPHGGSAKKVYIDRYHKNRAWRVLGNYEWRLTRAQAAQAVWEAHKEAEAEIRAMMPSVSYSWTDDAK